MNWLLKYHNWHQNPDEYIHRVNDPKTGAEALIETLHRYQFPPSPKSWMSLNTWRRTCEPARIAVQVKTTPGRGE